MTPLRLLTATVLSASALATVPMAGVIVFTPAVSSACLPGETAGASACAAFCLPGKALDVANRAVRTGAGPGAQRRQPADLPAVEPLGPQEGQQVGVDGLGVRGRHAVRKVLVGLQDSVLQ